ncbi:transposase [Streptomyces sp. AC555_RSS877]|uniref:transposase n=1 Tax=Streptomyces sp. AC555_RSS877 TaxID=2823688 RepID=UPI0035ABCD5F
MGVAGTASTGEQGTLRQITGHCQAVYGVLYRIRTGVQWSVICLSVRTWKTVHERHRRWSADGTWEMLIQGAQAEAGAVGEIDWEISVDSTSMLAHDHAAAARQAPPPAVPRASPARSKLLGSGRNWSTGWRRWRGT